MAKIRLNSAFGSRDGVVGSGREEGRAHARRDDRPQLVVCSVITTARKPSKRRRSCYLAQPPHIVKASGVGEEIVKQAQSILGWPGTKEQIHEAMRYVPDEFALRISATGTPDEARPDHY